MIERRAHPRVRLALPCTVRTTDVSFTSRTMDISLGGVSVALPPLGHVFFTGKVLGIEIEGLPELKIALRWRSLSGFGAAFVHAEAKADLLSRFLERNGVELALD